MHAYIFNQYYIDLLKRVKTVAKENRETSNTANAIYKSIKEKYVSLDKTSDEYLKFVNDHIDAQAWEEYVNADADADWIQNHKDLELYEGICLGNISKILDDKYLCHHFLTVFYIFRNEVSDEVSSNIVKILQSVDGKELMDQLENENFKKALTNLRVLRDKTIHEKAGINMNFIEDTTLGKLAKEILEDVDVGKLQKSMENNNDILKAIGDPESGFADIITNVSKKMANKISNGELKQENLIQDAMKFASMMPNLFGAGGNHSQKGGKKGGRGGGPDMSNIINMMSSMMGGMNDSDEDNNDHKRRGKPSNRRDTSGTADTSTTPSMADMQKMMKNMQNMMQQAPKGSRKTVNECALKKIAKAKKLKKKLIEKKKAAAAKADDTTNVSPDAVETQEMTEVQQEATTEV
jgi:hypothetical protein